MVREALSSVAKDVLSSLKQNGQGLVFGSTLPGLVNVRYEVRWCLHPTLGAVVKRYKKEYSKRHSSRQDNRPGAPYV